jgi:hypothetical protein
LDQGYRHRSGYFLQIFFHRMTLVKHTMVVIYNINCELLNSILLGAISSHSSS